MAGEVDVALMVSGARTPAIAAALADISLELASLDQADAYPQRYPYLARRKLHAGAVSFAPMGRGDVESPLVFQPFRLDPEGRSPR